MKSAGKNVTISLRIISQPKERDDNGDYIRAMHTANEVVVLPICSKHLRLLSNPKKDQTTLTLAGCYFNYITQDFL